MAKQLSAFEKEFAAARAKGKRTFDFNGKSYTTERKDDPPRRGKKPLSPAESPSKNTNTYTGRLLTLSEDAQDDAARAIGAEPPSKKRKEAIRSQASGYNDTDGGYARRQASFDDMQTSLSYDEAKKKKMGRGAFAAGGNVNNMAGMRQNPIAQMKRAANLVNTLKGAAGGTGMYGMKKGGKVGESEKMGKEGMPFMKKKGAPKMGEAKGMKRGGGKMMKFAKGGSIDGCAKTGHTRAAGHKK